MEGFELPKRYLSDDGQCAIDIDLFHGEESIDFRTLSDKAGRLLVECVSADGEGGKVFVPERCK